MMPKRVSTLTATSNIKTSLYDWDSPSSFTGTVKRRPSSYQDPAGKTIPPQYSNRNNNKQNTKRDSPSNHISPQEIVSGNCQSNDERTKDRCRRIAQSNRDESQQPIKLKGKPTKLRMPRPVDVAAKATKGVQPVGILKNSEHYHSRTSQVAASQNSDFSNSPQFRELFRDFPACYESTAIIGNLSMKSPPPPYREPPRPPPLPPTFTIPLTTGERQQPKFGMNRQRKGLIKSPRGQMVAKGTQPHHLQQVQYRTVDSAQDLSPKASSELIPNKQKSPYKGRVFEFRNCISRINSRSLFSLAGIKHADEDNSYIANSNEYVVYNPSRSKPEVEDDILAKPEFTSSLFKNIPIRPRKGGIPHLDNYYLFDPSVDFINEKELKKAESMTDTIEPDPGSEEEVPVEEIIYNDGAETENNYFIIDPDLEPANGADLEFKVPAFSESPLLTLRKPRISLPPFKSNSLRSTRSGSSMQSEEFQLRNRTIPIESNYVLFNPGPVPSRSVQYKIRKPRPLSTHSDADSGFLSPVSPEELKFNPAILILDQCDSVQGYIEIYTDWANYYLERVRSKKKVTDLSADCRDGLLLADVIEAVTSFKVPDLAKKPKNQQQMFDNVNSCLTVLRAHSVGGLEAITTNDICNGRLKAVLALFFALSRYKQQSKQQKSTANVIVKVETQPQQQAVKQPFGVQQPVQQPLANVTPTGAEAMTTRQIPAPYSKTNGGTAIPLPATVLVQRRCPPDKVRPLPPTPNHTPSIPGLAKTGEANNSRPGSPPSNSPNYTLSQKGNNGLRQPQCKIPASPYSVQGNSQNVATTAPQNTSIAGNSKHSMLDKLKLFNKEKSSSNNSSSKSQVSKRTSSSSGFSSARSERSDSSLSLNDGHISQIKPPNVLSATVGRNKDQSGKNMKQSKLLGSSQKATSREMLNVKSCMKQDKKDKSPSRKETDTHMIDSKVQVALKNPKIPTNIKADSKTKTSSKIVPHKLETRSESKLNLMPSSKPLLTTTAASTGIPKPMAAIKGTTKQLDKRPDNYEIKSGKSDISNNHGSISEISQEHRMHIINPISVMDNSNSIPNGPVGHMNKLLQSNSISMSDSLHSSSTHSGGGLHSNSSESSVIYRPSSESGSDVHYNNNLRLPPPNNPIPNRKLDFCEHRRDNRTNHQHQQDVASNDKFHTVPSKIVGTIYEEEKPVNVMPMRPLLRGYNSHVTLPTRGTRGQHYVIDYCESDIGQGYCSDGDALRRPQATTHFHDIDNGYLSEGSGSMHGKHFLSVMRARTQLPTTIEERIRNSRGSIDSIGTVSPSAGSLLKMDLNGSPSRSSSSRNGRDNWNKMPEPLNGHGQPLSPTSGRKEKSSPSHSRRNVSSSSQSSSKQQSSSGRTKGVPQSFGYVKRSNGSATGTITATDQQNILMMSQQQGGRTAHVSAVPRSGKVKVSGGTQTCTSDLQTKIPPNTQHRSFSLTGPGATQLSQSIRERLSTGSHSLPKPGTDMHVFQHRTSNRGSGKIIDGSLSDTQTYAEVKPEYSSYAMWLKHSNTASSRLSEGDSLESLQIGSPGMTRHGHKLLHREPPYIQSPRLNRSNSIRSTKSEKMYPSMLSRGPDVDIEPYYCLPVGTIQAGSNGHHIAVPWSQPTSPTPPNRGFGGPLSPTHAGPTNLTSCHRLTYPKKNDEVHGSAASLLSGGSSLYGSAEERQANEVRRLKRELTDARDQVMSLSSQLSTNAHVVAAFEQSLSNMTQRLQQLTATAERKDGELTDMRQTIELLRKQSIQAGLTTAHMQSMGVQVNCQNDVLMRPPNHHTLKAHPPTANGGVAIAGANAVGMQRHHSSDSMCSLNSISSGCSAQDKKKKKGWLRSSFTKAFSRNAKISKTSRHMSSTQSSLDQPSSGQIPTDNVSDLPPPSPTKSLHKIVPIIENAKPVDAIEQKGNPVVEDLKKQLREKDLVLTDIRLEALSSASQLESLKDTVMKMRAEMLSLKQNNERLQKLVTSRSLAGSEASLGNAISPNGSIGESRRYSLADGVTRPPMELPKSLEEEVEEENIPPAPAPEPPPPPLSPTTHIDLTPPPPAIEFSNATHLPTGVEEVPDHTDGKKISIAVYLGQPESFPKYAEEILESDNYYCSGKHSEDGSHENGFEERNSNPFPNPTLNEFIIAYTYISGKTTWQNLDYIVRKTFKDYVSRIDPGTNLGLNTDSITSYHLGEAKRGPEMGFPELLPCGYIIGNVRTLYICLQGVGCLAFDSLIPRSIVHRYISLLTEHRRLILCGPSGTGKSYLAQKLAEFLVARSGRGNLSEAIATFNVDHKSSKELRQYLGHIAEQASMSNGASELPSVIILDNLHHASALGDVFSCLLSAGPAAKLPCIIGTMSQATCNTTNLQLHHNFRWVLTANHMEPVKGFLGRFLRRRLFTLELSTHNQQMELTSVLEWLPTVWQHINRFLENHSSSDVTIGPRLFLSCPLDLKDSQVWFTDVWNHLALYLVEAVREGVQLYGRRGGAWNDPSTFIRDTYPWPYGPESVPPLRQISAEDVGLEAGAPGNNDSQDPLLNMLMRLQEAANYSGNQEQESDCASLDSNITPDSSAGAE